MTFEDKQYELDMDEKAEVSTHETAVLRSNYIDLSPREARHKFRRLYLMAMSLCIGGMYVGYSIVAPGNVVANPGFIQVGMLTSTLTTGHGHEDQPCHRRS